MSPPRPSPPRSSAVRWALAPALSALLLVSATSASRADDGAWVLTRVETARKDTADSYRGGGSGDLRVADGSGHAVARVPVSGTTYTWELDATWQSLPARLAPDELAPIRFRGARVADFQYRHVFGSPYLHTRGWLGVSAEGGWVYARPDEARPGAALRVEMRADSPEVNEQTYQVQIPAGRQNATREVVFTVFFGAEVYPQSEPIYAGAEGVARYTYTFDPAGGGASPPVPGKPAPPPCDRLSLDLDEADGPVVVATVVDLCERQPLPGVTLEIRVFHTWDAAQRRAINGEYVDREPQITDGRGQSRIPVGGPPGDIYRVDVYASKEGWDRSDRTIHVTIGGAAPAAPEAGARDRRVRITNETGVTITQLYGSNVDRDTWEEDILGADVLPPGGSLVVDFDDGTGACSFDLKAVFADGDEVTKLGVNVCEISTFRFTE